MSARRKTLFNLAAAAGPNRKPDLKSEAPANNEKSSTGAISVSSCVKLIKNALSNAFPEHIAVVGEISNVSIPASGHMYFSLKDSDSSISAVMWKFAARRLKFKPANGMEVVIEAKPDVYDAQGKLQLYVERMTPRGAGALEVGFQQLQEKLRGEGLFDPAVKKSIPRFPRAVGIVTSATGAAIRDIQRTLHQRFPSAKAYLFPAMVQGDGAAEEIATAVKLLDKSAAKFQIDTIIVARGGGSLEDLWAFNEEILARAVAAADTPIISGVGHETDVTICDMVADFRAATPTAAAECAVADKLELARGIANLSARLDQITRDTVERWKMQLDAILRSAVFRDPTTPLRNSAQRVDELSHRLPAALQMRLSGANRELEPLIPRLMSLSPERLCERTRAKLDAMTSQLRWALGKCSQTNGERLGQLESALKVANPANRLKLARQKIDAIAKHLTAMSYRSVLKRGFSVTRTADGKIIRSAWNINPYDVIETEFADGKTKSLVRKIESPDGKEMKTKKQTRKNSGHEESPSLFD
ncbi:MAG: exodeoxyribonuclease VII large subunit [Phycisphaerae bacterium]|nr:exodeoxyribonuclease VII large subunit [Phycisphaerae bacterium]